MNLWPRNLSFYVVTLIESIKWNRDSWDCVLPSQKKQWLCGWLCNGGGRIWGAILHTVQLKCGKDGGCGIVESKRVTTWEWRLRFLLVGLLVFHDVFCAASNASTSIWGTTVTFQSTFLSSLICLGKNENHVLFLCIYTC